MDLKELKGHYDFFNRTIVIPGGAGVLGGEIACALGTALVPAGRARCLPGVAQLVCDDAAVMAAHRRICDREHQLAQLAIELGAALGRRPVAGLPFPGPQRVGQWLAAREDLLECGRALITDEIVGIGAGGQE